MKIVDPVGTSRRIAAFPYHGGKHTMVRHLLPLVKSIEFKNYCEPFSGGLSLMTALELSDKNFAINDMNMVLIIMYKTIKLYPKSFYRMLDSTPFSRAIFQQSGVLVASCDTSDASKSNMISIAIACYVTISMSFLNKMSLGAGWRSSKFSGDDSGLWLRRKARVKEVMNLLDRAYIDCGSYDGCIKRWDTEKTLFYVDPPYIGTDHGHYGITGRSYSISKFSSDEYKKLCNTLDAIKGKYILSGYDCGIEPLNYKQRIVIPRKKKMGSATLVKTASTHNEIIWIG